MKQIAYALLAVIFHAGFVHGQLPNESVEKFTGTTMGTVQWNVSLVRPSGAKSVDVQGGVQQVLDKLNSDMSTWIPESEVSRFNNSETTDWFEVSTQTATVVRRSLEIGFATDGAFDITVKPLVELWNFGAGRGEFVLPADGEVHRILATTGFRQLDCRMDPPAIRKSVPEVQIDLSGIAKGYAVDLVRQWIVEQGISEWFIEVGGEVSIGGQKPDGSEWRVGIEKPLDDGRSIEHVVAPGNRCMATSGDYRNFAVVDGLRYSHTISPETGRPVEHALASVSVVAADCMTADALATAITVAGPDKMKEIAGKFAAEALAMERMEDGRFREIQTPGFAKFLRDQTSVSATNSGSPLGLMLTTVVLVGLAIIGLALGAIFANKPIAGSCGGLGNITGAADCQMCQGTENTCPEKQPESESA